MMITWGHRRRRPAELAASAWTRRVDLFTRVVESTTGVVTTSVPLATVDVKNACLLNRNSDDKAWCSNSPSDVALWTRVTGDSSLFAAGVEKLDDDELTDMTTTIIGWRTRYTGRIVSVINDRETTQRLQWVLYTFLTRYTSAAAIQRLPMSARNFRSRELTNFSRKTVRDLHWQILLFCTDENCTDRYLVAYSKSRRQLWMSTTHSDKHNSCSVSERHTTTSTAASRVSASDHAARIWIRYQRCATPVTAHCGRGVANAVLFAANKRSLVALSGHLSTK